MNTLIKKGILRYPATISSERVCIRFASTDDRAHKFHANNSPMLPPNTFKGKVAFIAGGGTGIGRSIAMMLSRLGADVAIVSRRLETVKKTTAEIKKETGGKVFSMQCDTSDELNVRNAISRCITELGLPSVVVNSSSKNLISPTERLSSADFHRIINATLNGTANVTFDIGKRLISAGQALGGATFLNISSSYANTGSGFVVASAAAKSGVNSLTKSLASEWSRYGMRFNTIALGPVSSKNAEFLRKKAMRMLDGDSTFSTDRKTTVGRTANEEEVANLATYLLSDFSNYMNGQVIAFDGGEVNYRAGEFNDLENISKENWDMIMDAARSDKSI